MKSYETVSHRFTRGPVAATAATAKLTGTNPARQCGNDPGQTNIAPAARISAQIDKCHWYEWVWSNIIEKSWGDYDAETIEPVATTGGP